MPFIFLPCFLLFITYESAAYDAGAVFGPSPFSVSEIGRVL